MQIIESHCSSSFLTVDYGDRFSTTDATIVLQQAIVAVAIYVGGGFSAGNVDLFFEVSILRPDLAHALEKTLRL